MDNIVSWQTFFVLRNCTLYAYVLDKHPGVVYIVTILIALNSYYSYVYVNVVVGLLSRSVGSYSPGSNQTA